MAYSDKVIDHYENPRNVGSFDKADTDIGTGMVGAPACGDVDLEALGDPEYLEVILFEVHFGIEKRGRQAPFGQREGVRR